MTVLRVLLDAAPAADRAVAWALYDARGECARKGRDRIAAWPSADRIEVVVAATQVRIATVALPPMAQSRVVNAAAFALEDQLAGPNAAHHVAVSTQSRDGRVRVAIVARSLVDAIVDACPSATRIVAECDLAVPASDWRWCSREPQAVGFVRRPDGSAFPTDPPSADGTLPAELALALAQARRAGTSPTRVRVDAPVSLSSLARWHREAGVEFVGGTPWEWEAAGAAAFADAIDLLPSWRKVTKASHIEPRRLFVPALLLAATALALHVVASSVEWASLGLQASRDANEWMSLAATAGVPQDSATTSATTPAAARLALARRYAQVRHDHGLTAPEDALPLLARAVPALAALPPGSVKRAAYADGHWTLDLALSNSAAIGELDMRLRSVGVSVLMAPSPNGVRMRIGGS